MKQLIHFFTSRHLITNVIFFTVFLVAFFSWHAVNKEELPEFARDVIRVSTFYPGAPAEDVELFVTKPIEEELKGVSGIYDIQSTSSLGSSNFNVSIDPNYPDKDEVIREIENAVLRVDFPAEVRDLPTFRQFKSSEKAIIDIALIHRDAAYLDQATRARLQAYALSFENQVTALPEISSIDKRGYLLPEIHVLMNPDKLNELDLSISEVHRQIQDNHIRAPIGSLNDRGESKVTALNELDTPEALLGLALRGTIVSPMIKLNQIADVRQGFERAQSITKVQGHEAIVLNIKKSASADILSAKKALLKFIEQHKITNADAPIDIILMDDESYDVTNRLKIIFTNGLLGFVLVVFVLFLFLDLKHGLWVAMGIPFALAFTVIGILLVGYTINNMTLAGIIIVMGIVVDDAIVIAENVMRRRKAGDSLDTAATAGTLEVIRPILASIITTCVAFIPLFFFKGLWGQIVQYIPLIVFLMLLGSLIESILILPSHLISEIPGLKSKAITPTDWFTPYEARYERLLNRLLRHKTIVFAAFALFLGASTYVFSAHMTFAMFPREEAKEIFIKLIGPEDATRLETAKLMESIEQMFITDKRQIVRAVRSSVGHSRRGGQVKENEGWIRVELLPANERDIPLRELIDDWEQQAKAAKGFKKVTFFRSWFGSGSGSAIELLVQENDNAARIQAAEQIKDFLAKLPSIKNAEIERPLEKKEYLFKIDQEKLVRLDIDPAAVTTALRAFVEGTILYTLNKGDEEVDVRLTIPEAEKTDLKELLKLKVANKTELLTDLTNFVTIQETMRPTNISRMNYKRSMTVYGDLDDDAELTPLEIAQKLEYELFPKLLNQNPGMILRFTGEVEESRDSQHDFRNSILLILILIYVVLIIMFNHLGKPLIIIAIIPFGLAGAAIGLAMHGLFTYGFFAVIGALGMIGVVVNDSIIMIDRLEKSFASTQGGAAANIIAQIASTRLRPVIVTTITTVVALMPTAYGILGFDSMLAEMMLSMAWGLLFATVITLILVPCLYNTLIRRDHL